jgi:hypothetical protein
MIGLDVTDGGQLEFPEVVRRKPAHFLRRSAKVVSFAFAREYLALRRKFSVRAERRSEKSITHHRERDPSSGRGTGKVAWCRGEVRFFRAMQPLLEIF